MLGRAAPPRPPSPPQHFLCTWDLLHASPYGNPRRLVFHRPRGCHALLRSALPAGARLDVLEVGAAPLVRRFLERLDLPGLLQRHLPALPGPRPALPSACALAVLLSNLL